MDRYSDFDSFDTGLGQHPPVEDQAHGLRRLFTGHAMRVVPLVSNPHLDFGGVLIERLCSAFVEWGLRTLIVDAGEHARTPAELVGFDLSEGIETLSPRVSYLAARGLPLRFVDARGRTGGFLRALAEAAPRTDVVLLHASAGELARLFGDDAQRLAPSLRPIVLCEESAQSITHAYAAIKQLAMRAGLMAHDLVLAAAPGSSRAALVAQRLAACADDFIGAAQHGWVAVDPAEPATASPAEDLLALAHSHLGAALAVRTDDAPRAATRHESALPSSLESRFAAPAF